MRNASRMLSLLAVSYAVVACNPSDGKPPKVVAPEDTDTGSVDTATPDEDTGSIDTAEAPDTSSLDTGPDVSVPSNVQWLKHDDGVPAGEADYQETPDEYIEYVRFRLDPPFVVHGLRAQFTIPEKTEITVKVWDDFSGNGATIRHPKLVSDAEPLATATRTLTPEDEDTWIQFAFDDPPKVDPGRFVYAGIVVDGSDAAQLQADKFQEPSQDFPPSSVYWRSNDPRTMRGFLPLGFPSGDFMVRLGVKPEMTIPEKKRSFQSKPLGDVGLSSIRRASLADVDGDGDLDVMKNGPELYLNEGDGTFKKASKSWLPSSLPGSNGGVFGDYDNDGDPDYFATGTDDRLLENKGSKFVDVTKASKIDDTQTLNCGNQSGSDKHVKTEAAAWFDADNDGWLDLYQANYLCQGSQVTGTGDRLWHNEGDGTFTSMPVPDGTGRMMKKAQAGRGVAPADADGDGRVDLFVVNYRLDPNFFFLNDSTGFSDASKSSNLIGVKSEVRGRTYYGHGIGAAWGDVNHDGRLDAFVANLAHPRYYDFSQKSTLYLNKSGMNGPVFENVTEKAGIRYQETPSNPNFFDYDNDGDLDLFFTCVYDKRRSQFYRNNGHPDWEEVSYRTGVTVMNGWGSVVGDLDNDGDLDLLAGDKVFFNENDSGKGAVFVRPVGSGAGKTNVSGIGARVKATIDGETVVRERYGGHGTGVQDSPWLHVGLDGAQKTDLTVLFPRPNDPMKNWAEIDVKDAKAGQRITVKEDGTVSRTTP